MCDGRTQCMTVLLMHPWPEAEPISQARAPLCRSTKWAHPARRYICKILPATWHATSLSDRWRGHGAGGAPPSWTWGANPQFRLSCAVGASVVIVCAQPDTKNLKQESPCGSRPGAFPICVAFVLFISCIPSCIPSPMSISIAPGRAEPILLGVRCCWQMGQSRDSF
jgi:hypothetical protein